MLSRTADHLYWMSRYIERAESLARLVDAHYRMSLLPQSAETLAQSLSATMTALQMEQAYREASRDHRAARRVRVREPAIATIRGSIVSCLRAARENARAVRGIAHLGALGDAELHLARCPLLHGARAAAQPTSAQFVEWVKERSHLTRGVTIGTMLRDEAFHFTRIGTFLERADSTARILTAHQQRPRARGRRRRRARPLPVERAAARALGVRGVPARVPRRDHAATKWRRC